MDDLVNAASSALVSAMVTDAWTWVKEGFVRIFGRGGASEESVENKLEASRGELVTASGDDAIRARIESAWRTRILDILEDHPDLVPDLSVLVEKVSTKIPSSISTGPIVQSAAAFDTASQAVQGSGVQTNTFGSSDGRE